MSRTGSRGFTVLEVAISLLLVGLLLSAGLGALGSAARRGDALAAERFQQALRQALVNFAATHHRLPCPDTDMDGHENADGGCAERIGGAPYYTLNVTPGTSISNTVNGRENMLYGVYRNAAIDADLSVVAERTNDAEGEAGYENGGDFREALNNASNHQSASGVVATEIHVTGDGRGAGSEDCDANRVANMAFVLISAGVGDTDNDGNPFDGLNRFWSRAGNSVRCASSPGKLRDVVYDDTVIAVSFDSLLGDLQ